MPQQQNDNWQESYLRYWAQRAFSAFEMLYLRYKMMPEKDRHLLAVVLVVIPLTSILSYPQITLLATVVYVTLAILKHFGMMLSISLIYFFGRIYGSLREYFQRKSSHNQKVSRLLNLIEEYKKSAEYQKNPELKQILERLESRIKTAQKSTLVCEQIFLDISNVTQLHDYICETKVEQNTSSENFEQNKEQSLIISDLAISPPKKSECHRYYRAQRVYRSEANAQNQRYTIQLADKDTQQKEYAAKQMATLFGFGDLIPDMKVYHTSENLSQPINEQRETLEFPQNDDCAANLTQDADGPSYSHSYIVREEASDTNLKESVYQTMFQNTGDSESVIQNIDIVSAQRLMLLQFILGSQSDLCDISVKVNKDGKIFLRSDFNNKIMPTDNHIMTSVQTVTVCNDTEKQWYERDLNLLELSGYNMHALQLPIMALPHASVPWEPGVISDFLSRLNSIDITDFHEKNRLFSESQILCQEQRLAYLRQHLQSAAAEPYKYTPDALYAPFYTQNAHYQAFVIRNIDRVRVFGRNEEAERFIKKMFLFGGLQNPVFCRNYLDENFPPFVAAFDAGIERNRRTKNCLFSNFHQRTPQQGNALLSRQSWRRLNKLAKTPERSSTRYEAIRMRLRRQQMKS